MAYFVSYRYVLEKIKIMDDWEDLPLSAYIVNGLQLEGEYPLYLENGEADVFFTTPDIDKLDPA